MKKKTKKYNAFFYAFAALLAAVIVQVNTPSASTAPVVVVLSNSDTPPYQQLYSSFEKNLLQEYPGAEISFYLRGKDRAKHKAILKKARRKKPNVVLALGNFSIRDALKEFPDTPIVASMATDNDAFVHADNITGVLLHISPEMHFQWLNRFLPDRKQIGILYDPEKNRQWINDAGKYAGNFGLNVIPIKVNSAKDLPNALKELNRKADVLLGIPDQTVYTGKTAKMVLLYSFRSKIPFVGLSKSWVKAGALYGLEWDYGDIGRQCASIASKILNGTAAGDIPVQETTGDSIYTVNMKTAQHLKLHIDPALLDGAAYIFE